MFGYRRCNKPATDLKKFSAQKPAEDFQNNSPTQFSGEEEETEQNEMPKEEFVPDSGIGQMFFTTTGRLNRWRYLKRILVVEIFGGILSTAGIFLDNALFRQEYGLFYVIAQSFLLWPAYCLDVRRLQDLNRDAELAIFNLFAGAAVIAIDPSTLDYYFDTGSFPAHMSSKEKFGYFQSVPFAVEGAKEVTLKIAEMIDPADYILTPENKSALIEHLNLTGDDLYIRTFENSNDTRIEKLSQNIIIGSVGVIRFSDKYDKDLSEWRKDFLLQTVREFENVLGQFDLPR